MAAPGGLSRADLMQYYAMAHASADVDTVVPQGARGMVVNHGGVVSNYGGLVQNNQGMVQNVRGQVQNFEGAVNNTEGTVYNEGGGVVNVRGMVQNMQGRVSNYGGIVGNAYGEVFNASGACKNVGGRVQNVQGFVDNHGGTVLNTPIAAKNPPGSPQLSPLSAAATPIAANPLAAYQAHLGYAPEEWALFEKMKLALEGNLVWHRTAHKYTRWAPTTAWRA
eukprot:Tamp_16646.p1 GENE.Tamp_16646~~Tamp_16646.p1  ORF type:complete len:247 (-),score=45.46 Tamp_16646:704-1369(-)